MTEEGFFSAAGPREAYDLLAKYGDDARLLAGGTDVMVAVNKRTFTPRVLIYIGDAGLNYIKHEGEDVLIGAATPFTDILKSSLVAQNLPFLKEVVSHIASPAIRNAGTIGGNLGTSSPAADSAIALLALGASLKLVSKNGERSIAVENFFTGPRENALQGGEMIVEISIPVQGEAIRWAYRKIGQRKAQSLSVVSVGICFKMEDNTCRNVRIALGAVAPTPLLAVEAASLLEGKTLNAEVIEAAARAAADATNPIDDARSTAWYRKRASGALVKQLLEQIST